MFKLKFAHIKDPQFTMALRKLMGYTGYKDTKTAYNVAKVGRKFDQEAKTCQDLYLKHVKNHALLDEKGELVCKTQKVKDAKGVETDQKLPGTYVIPDEKNAAWEAACKEFDETEFEVPCHLIKLSDVEGAKLSPQDLLSLEPVLTELEGVPEKKNNPVASLKPQPAQPTVQ